LAALARARQVRELADLIGRPALSMTDRLYLDFEISFARDLVDQHRDEPRTLEDTLDRAWRVLSLLPHRELTMLPAAQLDLRHHPRSDSAQDKDPS